MNIGLDYDDTFTVDPGLWMAFISQAVIRNHKVYITTFRQPKHCTPQWIDKALNHCAAYGGVTFVPTSLKAKKGACEALGIKIDVWIDDNPAAVYIDHPRCYIKGEQDAIRSAHPEFDRPVSPDSETPEAAAARRHRDGLVEDSTTRAQQEAIARGIQPKRQS